MRFFRLPAPLLILAAAPLSVPPARAQNDAASLFKTQCSGCHGGDGRGNTPAGKSAKIHDLHSPDVQNQSDAQLAEIITAGIRSSRGLNYSMPSHRDFTEDQVKRLVVYIRNLPAK
jgi:mono/diheme cytochrome c family protein